MSPIPRDTVGSSPQGPAQIDPMGIVPLVQLLLMPLIPILEVLALEMVSRRYRVVVVRPRDGNGRCISHTVLKQLFSHTPGGNLFTNIGLGLDLLWKQLVCHACGKGGAFGPDDHRTPSVTNVPGESPTFNSPRDFKMNAIGRKTGTWQSDITLCEKINGSEEVASPASSSEAGGQKVQLGKLQA